MIQACSKHLFNDHAADENDDLDHADAAAIQTSYASVWSKTNYVGPDVLFLMCLHALHMLPRMVFNFVLAGPQQEILNFHQEGCPQECRKKITCEPKAGPKKLKNP